MFNRILLLLLHYASPTSPVHLAISRAVSDFITAQFLIRLLYTEIIEAPPFPLCLLILRTAHYKVYVLRSKEQPRPLSTAE